MATPGTACFSQQQEQKVLWSFLLAGHVDECGLTGHTLKSWSLPRTSASDLVWKELVAAVMNEDGLVTQ